MNDIIVKVILEIFVGFMIRSKLGKTLNKVNYRDIYPLGTDRYGRRYEE